MGTLGVRAAAVKLLLRIYVLPVARVGASHSSQSRLRFAIWTPFVAFDALCSSWLCTECFYDPIRPRFRSACGWRGLWNGNGFALLVTLAPRGSQEESGIDQTSTLLSSDGLHTGVPQRVTHRFGMIRDHGCSTVHTITEILFRDSWLLATRTLRYIP